MRKAALISALVVAAGFTACRSDRVDLAYRYRPNSQVDYRLTTSAAAEWNVEGRPGSGSYTITYDVTETIEEVEDGNAVVAVEMDVVDVVERGLTSPGSGGTSFKLRLGPAGEKLEVLDLDGVPAADLGQEQLAFINTFRPPLPLDPVGLHGTWPGRQAFEFPDVSQKIVAHGELSSLKKVDDRELADLDYVWEGPYEGTLRLPQGTARFEGTEEVRASATFDLSGGFPRSQSSTTVDRFDVRLQAGDGSAPRQGTLVQQIRSELDFVGSA